MSVSLMLLARLIVSAVVVLVVFIVFTVVVAAWFMVERFSGEGSSAVVTVTSVYTVTHTVTAGGFSGGEGWVPLSVEGGVVWLGVEEGSVDADGVGGEDLYVLEASLYNYGDAALEVEVVMIGGAKGFMPKPVVVEPGSFSTLRAYFHGLRVEPGGEVGFVVVVSGVPVGGVASVVSSVSTLNR
ncbi:MAG: hypothetical protein F7C09_07005 [Aeropyrum sp.]|nr:hypothetical protein [Aeropyrum sp.]